MRFRLHALLVAAGITAAAVPALAHHSLFAVFDEGQTVTLKGTVSKVEWVNPHVYLYLAVTDPAGTLTTWAVETFPPSTLRRAGLTREKLGLGQNITLVGYKARNGKDLAFLRTITFADGREVMIALGDIKEIR
jgi:hypothetical protein